MFIHLEPMHRFEMILHYEAIGNQTKFGFTIVFENEEEVQRIKSIIISANEENFDRLEQVVYNLK